MQELKLKTRIQNKYKTLSEWNSLQEGDFIPLKGEICYAVEDGTVYQKIGDGTTDFTKLDWLFSKAIQSDWNENDTTSSAYIKNRICYSGPGDVPSNQQDIIYFEESNVPIFDTEIFSVEDALGVPPEQLGLPVSLQTVVQCNLNTTFSFKDASYWEKLQNPINEFVAYMGESTNQYSFNLDLNNYIDVISDNDEIINLRCFLVGNPIIANLIIPSLFDIDGDFTLPQFSLTNNTDLKYCLLIFASSQSECPLGTTVFVGDVNDYYVENPRNITFCLKHIKQLTDYPIDGKYLSEAQANLYEIDSSKPSYIKNNHSNFFVSRVQDFENRSEDFSGKYKIKGIDSEGVALELLSYTNNLPFNALFNYEITGFDVSINGILYKNCPIQQISKILYTEQSMEFIGNPKLLSSTLASNFDDIFKTEEVYLSPLEDNGLPFMFIIDRNDASLIDNTVVFDRDILDTVSINSEVNIIISVSHVALMTRYLSSYYIPKEMREKIWNFNKNRNSIFSTTAYNALGTNSFAIGAATNSSGRNSMAGGSGSKSDGYESFAFGLNTEASGQQSVALNNSTMTAGQAAYSIAAGLNTKVYSTSTVCLGENTISSSGAAASLVGGTSTVNNGIGNLAFGLSPNVNSSYGLTVGSIADSILLTVTRPSEDRAIITFSNVDEIPSVLKESHLCYKFSQESNYINATMTISSDKLTYTFSFRESHNISYTKLNVYVQSYTSGWSAINLGSGNTVQGASLGIGRALLVKKDYQYVIGKYNKEDETHESNLFIIGNGTNLDNRSNALTVDNAGNLKILGSLYTSSIVLSSPNGTQFKLTVDDNGILTTTQL